MTSEQVSLFRLPPTPPPPHTHTDTGTYTLFHLPPPPNNPPPHTHTTSTITTTTTTTTTHIEPPPKIESVNGTLGCASDCDWDRDSACVRVSLGVELHHWVQFQQKTKQKRWREGSTINSSPGGRSRRSGSRHEVTVATARLLAPIRHGKAPCDVICSSRDW